MAERREPEQNGGRLSTERLRLPDHVVCRRFARETVLLNVRTGRYHGLNPTAGRMVELLDRGATPAQVAERLGSEYDLAPARVAEDLESLCRALLARGLVEVDEG